MTTKNSTYIERYPLSAEEAKLSASVAYAEAFYAAKKSRRNRNVMVAAQSALAEYQEAR